MFGGNSNWRGPIWMPVNMLIVRALLQYYAYYGDSFIVECPTGSGRPMNLYQVAEEIARRLSSLFLGTSTARRPVHGGSGKFHSDPHWRDYPLFYEYFHGDSGAGVGASHQTGWTGGIARLMTLFASSDARTVLAQKKEDTAGESTRSRERATTEEPTHMKAITVEPTSPRASASRTYPRPGVHDGSVLVEAVAVGVCGTDVEIIEGKYGWAPPGQTRLVLGHESLGRVLDPGPTGGLQNGRPGRRHRAPSRPRALSQLRRWRVGHVPQRPVHGARHQADRRLHVRTLANRARVRHEGGPLARAPGRAARAHHGRRQSLGAGAVGRQARLLGANEPCWSPARARSACWRRWSVEQHGLDVHVLDRADVGRQARARSCPGRDVPYRAASTDVGFKPDVIVECTGVGRSSRTASRWPRCGGVVCLTGVGSGGRTTGLHRRCGRGHGAPEQRGRRQREREQTTLVQGGAGAGASGPLVARPAHHAGAKRPETFHAGSPTSAGRHQGRHPVRGAISERREAVHDSGVRAQPPRSAASCAIAD